ncbi:MAG: 16S rRNA (uracil(1498)-N(3))-methyltransferase [Sphingomicrobium sp.]|nr:16S rRNA (uracil(1498)-N(3))-methyltransferase [Sphingomonadales bacterium]
MPAIPAWPPRSLPRLFVAAPLNATATVVLDAKQANYLANVLRLGVGGEALLFDGRSGEWFARVRELAKKRMILTVERQTRPIEQVPDLTLAFAPVKRAQLDWLVEKATELGVARLVPVITHRTVVERVKLDRLEAIAIEAAEQCGRTLLSEIGQPIALDRLLAERAPARTLYFADEQGGARLADAFAPGPAMILTGPEGGFTDEERTLIRATPGVRAISLGPRILRAETAALAAVAAWMALAGDWRSPGLALGQSPS